MHTYALSLITLATCHHLTQKQDQPETRPALSITDRIPGQPNCIHSLTRLWTVCLPAVPRVICYLLADPYTSHVLLKQTLICPPHALEIWKPMLTGFNIQVAPHPCQTCINVWHLGHGWHHCKRKAVSNIQRTRASLWENSGSLPASNNLRLDNEIHNRTA